MEETLKLILNTINNLDEKMSQRFDQVDLRLDKIEKSIKSEVLVLNNKLDDVRDDVARVENAITNNFSKIRKIEKAVSSSKTELETVKRVAYGTALNLSNLESNIQEI